MANVFAMTPRSSRRPQPSHVPSVAETIKQTKPFRTLGQEAMMALFLASDAVRRTVAVLLAEHSGLTPQQYNVLRILRGAGEKGLPTLEIPERMIEQAPGITRLIDRLERKKWVQRERPDADRRQVICRITRSGLALLARIDEQLKGKDEEIVAMLSQKETRVLIDLLNRIRAGQGAPSVPTSSLASTKEQ
jgi:DNA-binding MarR family transcriptional regulator